MENSHILFFGFCTHSHKGRLLVYLTSPIMNFYILVSCCRAQLDIRSLGDLFQCQGSPGHPTTHESQVSPNFFFIHIPVSTACLRKLTHCPLSLSNIDSDLYQQLGFAATSSFSSQLHFTLTHSSQKLQVFSFSHLPYPIHHQVVLVLHSK